MASFWTLRSSQKSLTVRMVFSILMAAPFGFGYFIYSAFFDGVNFDFSNYFYVLVCEWIIVAKPVFMFIFPPVFLASLNIFQKRPWQGLLLKSLIVSMLITMPGYLVHYQRWRVANQILKNLPITKLSFDRYKDPISWGDPGMGISFLIPGDYDDFINVKRAIEKRIDSYSDDLSKMRLDSGRGGLEASFSAWKVLPHGKYKRTVRYLKPEHFISDASETKGYLHLRP